MSPEDPDNNIYKESSEICRFCGQPMSNHELDCSFDRLMKNVQNFAEQHDKKEETRDGIILSREKVEITKILLDKFSSIILKIDSLFSLIDRKFSKNEQFDMWGQYNTKADELSDETEFLLTIIRDFTDKYFNDKNVKIEWYRDYCIKYVDVLEKKVDELNYSIAN